MKTKKCFLALAAILMALALTFFGCSSDSDGGGGGDPAVPGASSGGEEPSSSSGGSPSSGGSSSSIDGSSSSAEEAGGDSSSGGDTGSSSSAEEAGGDSSSSEEAGSSSSSLGDGDSSSSLEGGVSSSSLGGSSSSSSSSAAPTGIAAVSIQVTAPATGGTPNNSASSSEAGYSVGAVQWSPSGGSFLGRTAYTATVTLTANAGYTFTGLASAKINGYDATVSDNTGNAVKLSYEFPLTIGIISAANIHVTAPAKGDAPSSVASTSDAGYTVGAAQWSPSHNPFRGGTAYTATVTLTAKEGYTLANLASATIDGHEAAISGKTSGSATLSHTFHATLDKEVTNVAIKTQPGKLIYTHGEALNLAGLAVTLTYDDGTSEDVASPDFDDYIETEPYDGQSLSRSLHDGGKIKVEVGTHSAETSALTVNAKQLANDMIGNIGNVTYTGSPLTPSPAVTDGSAPLVSGKDYAVGYSNNTNAGTATLTISGAGNYTGTASKTFTINPKTLTASMVSNLSNATYNGSAHTPSYTVTDGSALTPGTDYTASWSNNTNAGTATLTITGAGNYTGNVAKTFTINKAAGAAVSGAPAVSTRTASGITVNAVTVSGGNGQTVEYAVSTGTTAPSSGWQSGTSFSELTSATVYYVFARSASNGNYNAGTAQMSAEIKTLGTCGARTEQFDVDVYECRTGGKIYLKTKLLDSRNNKEYEAVLIGTQTWMAENLNYAATDSKCYQNTDSNCDTYGRLYNWATAMAIDASYNTTSYTVTTPHQGVCPSGWHLPSDAEWTALTTAISTEPGKKLKASSSLWTTNTGTDDYGFSALPGGGGGSSGSFFNVGSYALFWSSTQYNASYAYRRRMDGGDSDVSRYPDDKSSYLYSVRCLQD